jgi:hypothetical protein
MGLAETGERMTENLSRQLLVEWERYANETGDRRNLIILCQSLFDGLSYAAIGERWGLSATSAREGAVGAFRHLREYCPLLGKYKSLADFRTRLPISNVAVKRLDSSSLLSIAITEHKHTLRSNAALKRANASLEAELAELKRDARQSESARLIRENQRFRRLFAEMAKVTAPSPESN